jgi:hypothetical protein
MSYRIEWKLAMCGRKDNLDQLEKWMLDHATGKGLTQERRDCMDLIRSNIDDGDDNYGEYSNDYTQWSPDWENVISEILDKGDQLDCPISYLELGEEEDVVTRRDNSCNDGEVFINLYRVCSHTDFNYSYTALSEQIKASTDQIKVQAKKCTCGAAKTSNPNLHSSWCDLY